MTWLEAVLSVITILVVSGIAIAICTPIYARRLRRDGCPVCQGEMETGALAFSIWVSQEQRDRVLRSMRVCDVHRHRILGDNTSRLL